MNWSNVAAALLVAGGFVAIVTVFPPTSEPPKNYLASSTICRAIPTHVVEFGIQIHVVHDELYLCFQQEALNGSVTVQGMTEITCVPMKVCR